MQQLGKTTVQAYIIRQTTFKTTYNWDREVKRMVLKAERGGLSGFRVQGEKANFRRKIGFFFSLAE